jgi:hypothetical protein
MPTTSRVWDVDTVKFCPATIPFPTISTEDYLKQAAGDILTILRNPPTNLPYLAYGDATTNALVQITKLLGRAPLPTPTPVEPPRVQTPIPPPPQPTPVQPTVQNPVRPPRVETPVSPPRVHTI